MGFFSALDIEGYDRQYTDRQLVGRMLQYFRPHRAQMFVVAILILVMSLTGAAIPLIVSKGVDLLSETMNLRTVAFLSSAVLAAGTLNWGANWWRRRWTVKILGDIVLALRSDAFASAAEHDLSFYDKYSSGRILSRISTDSSDFGLIVTLLTDLIGQLIQAFILGAVLVSIEWRLALLLFWFIPIIFLTALGFRRLARTVTRAGMRAMANVNATIKETISGIAIAKNFRQEETIFQAFDDANQTSYRVNLRRGVVLAMVFPTLDAIGGIGTALLVFIGGMNTIQGAISIGAWYLFIQGLNRFFFPVLNLSAFWAQVQSGLSAAERIFALIDAEPAVVQVDQCPAPPFIGRITFEGVWFRYSEKESILEDFHLDIKPGENLALVGHTGAGKSSIAKLIARFYEFQKGRILVDGMDIRSFNLIEYRQQLGVVAQIPFLFSGSVMENICYACSRNLGDGEIEGLANKIGNGEWLETLPNGLLTEVGERGSRLSMGQRQLVSLMRVLVQKPAIFILDEATASIDPFTEWQIQQALALILENTTSILIAHRLSTVKAADRIIVLDNGRIIEEGTHNSLLDGGGHYASLYNTYFRHQSLSYIDQVRNFSEGD